ncbi:MAG: glycine betaine/L-proline ABC transporter substrate-binding protein ProX [Cyanobacteria bacterium SBLK]|nr:glycine betaine/L-proline ABC transporter substrate-binding protein ProX [Cyanobacteria bacterium SBLK]
MKKLLVVAACITLLSGMVACENDNKTQESSATVLTGLPGEGKTVKPVHDTIAEEHFQTAVVSKLLEKLGYEVEEPAEVTPAIMFFTLAQGDVDFTAIFWERLHQNFYEGRGGDEKLAKLGVIISETLQGYQIDKKTAEKYNITHLDQLKDPEIAKLFDSDRNGKANLAGCNPGSGCELAIEHHLDAYGLRDTVEHDQGAYGILLADVMTRYEQGESVLFYIWSPLWFDRILKPGEDTIWLEVPYTDLPKEQGDISEKDTTVKGKNLGFVVDRVRIAANREFIEANPAAKKLFELVTIPVDDINAQNLLMRDGENSQEDVSRHADEWIAKNQDTVDGWIEEVLQVDSKN